MQKKNQIAQMRARNNDLKPLTAISNFNKLTYDVPIYTINVLGKTKAVQSLECSPSTVQL